MYQNNIFDGSDGEDKLLALLGAMKDGVYCQFNYDSLTIRKDDETIEVIDRNGMPRGKLHNWELIVAAEWIEEKAEQYGVE